MTWAARSLFGDHAIGRAHDGQRRIVDYIGAGSAVMDALFANDREPVAIQRRSKRGSRHERLLTTAASPARSRCGAVVGATQARLPCGFGGDRRPMPTLAIAAAPLLQTAVHSCAIVSRAIRKTRMRSGDVPTCPIADLYCRWHSIEAVAEDHIVWSGAVFVGADVGDAVVRARGAV